MILQRTTIRLPKTHLVILRKLLKRRRLTFRLVTRGEMGISFGRVAPSYFIMWHEGGESF